MDHLRGGAFAMGPEPPGTSGSGVSSDAFSGIDPESMARFIASMERARETLGAGIPRIVSALEAVDVDRSAVAQLREAEGWVAEQLPELRRRNDLIRKGEQAADWAPGLVAFDEGAYVTAGEAAAQGRRLAERFAGMRPEMDSNYSNHYDELGALLDELAARRHDPDFTAAFLAAAGLGGATTIVEKLRRHGLETTSAHRRALAEAVNTAVTKRPDALGAEWRPESLASLPAGVLGVLVARGRYSGRWLSELVRPQVGKAVESARGREHRRWVTGLTPFLSALADNPEVARDLLNDLPREDLVDLFSELNRSVSRDFDVPVEFGRMLAAGAGVFEERSPDAAAAKFAFNVMTTMGSLRTPPDILAARSSSMEVAEGTRTFLAMIAGAYPAEMIDGAHRGDANRTKGSAFAEGGGTMPGIEPKFRLSPDDTYLFMKTFADTDARLKPFEEGMGRFTRVLLDDALRKDAGGGIENLSRLFSGLGYVYGTQLAAAEEVRKGLDEADQARNDRLKLASDALFGVAGAAVPAKVTEQALWITFSLGASEGLGALAEIDDTRVKALDDRERVGTLGRSHWILHELHRAGFAYAVPPDAPEFAEPPITDAEGKILPFSTLVADPETLKNFNNWMIANGSGSWDTTQAAQAADDLSDWFNGAKEQAQRESEHYERSQKVTPSPSSQSPPKS
ncbi:hypothetical protein [Planomonospora sp. ID82291]|uniref:hypothetical protein n=1 Tax=Planomonospora sp. ID82291 TaxID=2738136 RepID=UPI0018C36707|nr:hypothetical protein [Planomonospora sp. ID82291]MBG0817426.1 hypothetical protein [Planomonospora sp. ID82291]